MNKEEIYDKQISPLVLQIVEICEANKIAMLMTFAIPTDELHGLTCASALLSEECSPPIQFLLAHEMLQIARTKLEV